MKSPSNASPKKTDARDLFALLELSDLETLDLHGFDRLAAAHELSFFLERALARRSLGVKIVHGHGQQILAKTVEQSLQKRDLPFRGSTLSHEAGAVIYVIISPEKA